MNSTNSSSEPTEKLVLIADDQQQPQRDRPARGNSTLAR